MIMETIMIRKLLLFTLVVAFLAACSGNLPATELPGNTPTPIMVEPTQRPLPGPINNAYLPEPGDSNFSRGNVFIDSSDLLIMESYPIQIALVLNGNLPTPCNQLRVVANPPDEQNRIQVEVYSVIDPAEMCIQVLEPFEANIGLGSFPSGHYSVWVNGAMVAEFDA
jgi:hypothetical protein